jgi:hypothetical protein
VVDLPDDEDDEEEDGDERPPWADSVPGAGFDRPEPAEEPGQAMVFLGQVVRFDRDRRHPESLALEAVDILRRLVQGEAVEVVDKVLEDLLGDSDASA